MCGTWNVGGVASDRIFASLASTSAPNLAEGADIWALQEMARGKPQGVGVLFNPKNWILMRRKTSDRGIWCRFRRCADGAELWVGSLYIPPSYTHAMHADTSENHIKALPPTALPVCLGGDINAPVQWIPDAGEVLPGGDGKTRGFLNCIAQRKLRLLAPHENQYSAPTCFPRNGARPRQIDVCLGMNARWERTHIRQDSRHQIVLTMKILEQLAQEYTKPVQRSTKYKDPERVRQAFAHAKRSRDPADWKFCAQNAGRGQEDMEARALGTSCRRRLGGHPTVQIGSSSGVGD